MSTDAIEKKLQELGLGSSPAEFLDSLTVLVKRRVEALQELQGKHEELSGEFRKELALLEAKYERLYDKGIPEFWLTALLKCDVTAELIKDKDIEVLKYLKDIMVLEKAYHMLPEDDGVLEKAEGTKIEWKAGRDVTIKIMKKKPKKGAKPDTKPQIKTEKVDSFFNFFSPPELPDDDEEIDEEVMDELQATIEADYEVGAVIREKLIPNAVGWFTGEAVDEENAFGMEDYDEEDE
ncbi:uncharacterized protein HaLaN_10781, partial [Haematococcus lacustris]